MDDIRRQSDEDFITSVQPQLAALEKIRQVRLKVYIWRRRIGIVAGTLLTPPCAFLDWMLLRWQAGNDDSAAGITVLMIGALYWWITQPKRQYAKAYKMNILPKIAQLFGDLHYDADGEIPMNILKPSKIVPQYNRYSSEDYFTGVYKGVNITLAEIELKQKRGSGKNSSTVTVFKGLAILIDLARQKFHGHTVLVENAAGIGQWFKKMTLDLKRANLVDPEFEKAFDVYTSDQVEARYLIDPVIIEEMKKMRDAYEAKSFSAAYFDNRVLVMLPAPARKNYFEPASIHVPATNPQSVLGMKHELGLVLNLVDRLDLFDPAAVQAQAPILAQAPDPIFVSVK